MTKATPENILITSEDKRLLSTAGWEKIISLIRENFHNRTMDLLVFEIHGSKIQEGEWSTLGDPQNKFNILDLFDTIYKRLTPDEQEHFKNLFESYEPKEIGWDPALDDTESIMRGIKYRLNKHVSQSPSI